MAFRLHYQYMPPIFYITALYASGIIFQWYFWYTFCILGLLAPLFYFITRNNCFLALYCCLIFGATRYQCTVYNWHNFAQNVHKKTYTTYGCVHDIAHTTDPHPSTKIRCTIKDPTCPLYNKTVLIYTKRKIPVRYYDTVHLNNITINRPNTDTFCNYLIKEHVAATIFAPSTALEITHNKTLLGALAEVPCVLLYALQTKMSPRTFNFFSSLFMGKRTQETIQTQVDFKKWGIAHYIARSGLHLAIIAGLWEFLVRFIPLSWCFRQTLLIYIITTYFLLTWPSISFIRSISTYLIIKFYALKKRQHHFLHVLLSILFLFLLYNPLYLFFLDFQLTFLLTATLVWFATINAINIKLLPTKNRTL